MELPPRTNLTSLTNDELLLFDFLFDCSTPRKFLYRRNYSESMNCLYNHSLSDREVDDTMVRMESEGLVESHCRDVRYGISYSLLPAGGELWEQERKPVWDRYCSGRLYTEVGVKWIELKCSTREIGESALRATDAAHLHSLDIDHIELKYHRENDCLVYWKKSPHVFVLRCRRRKSDAMLDWEIYESRRKWWRTIDELVNLKL